ncbi:MAG TPA: hypothetical protein VGG72_29680 [Bryobacteraceae bacterium]
MWRLAVVHLLANAVLLGCGYYWLGIGESRSSALAVSALIGLLLVALACSTYGATFAFFSAAERKQVSTAWKIAARNVLPMATAAFGIAVLYWLLAMWQDYSSDPAFTLASYFTLTFRKPVTPAAVLKVFDWALWLLRWAVLPVLLLPMLAAISTDGWRGFGAIGARARKWWYWLAAPLLLLGVAWIPLKVLGWTPRSGNFAMEVVSFLLRATLAYLLFGAAWLALAFATSAGKPRFTQSNTVVSP